MNISSVSAQAYQALSSGQRINSAADDAAGLSIAQGMTSEIKGMEQNVNNIGSMNDLTKTAEGALGNVNDGLMRMRELAVQASNGILTDSDKSIIQNEIDQIKEGISQITQNTQFNGKDLLNGEFSNMNTSMNTDGSGIQVSISSSALEDLGIADFDVTGAFDISDIDNAINTVNETRSELGSVSNAFDHATNSVQNNIVNTSASRSRIQDADMASEISKLKRQEVLNAYQMFAQKAQSEQDENQLGMLRSFDTQL